MSIKLKIETYLKRLALHHKEDLIKDILRFLKNDVKTKNATDNEELIAKLFCRAVESLNQDEILKDDIKEAIIGAFKNIKTIANNIANYTKTGELMCVHLLNLLYSNNNCFDVIAQDEFVLLLDNLEKIRCIFRITGGDGNHVFPIGKLLFKLINSDNLLEEIKKASSVQALMLALQVFDKNQYTEELNNIQNMIKGKNLRFIEYLYNKCDRIGNEDWKENYEKNGLLILYDSIEKKILIRNNKHSYFEIKKETELYYDTKNYQLSDVTAEKNDKNEDIAYFIEYPVNNCKFVDLNDELNREDNIDRIAQILDIIYYYRNYNVIYKDALQERNGKIYPTNPFGKNDAFVVGIEVSDNECKKHISNKLLEYGLLKISGTGLRYINLGAIVKLDEIFAIQFKDFKISEESNLNDVIECWLDKCGDKKKCFNEFFKVYVEQINYIFDQKTIYKKKYNKEYLIPSTVSEVLLQKLELDEKFTMYTLDKCNLENVFLKNELIIKNSEGVKLDGYTIEDIAGEDKNVPEGDFIALVNNSEKKIYTGIQVEYYYWMKENIKHINKGVISEEDIKKVTESDVQSISDQMSCFEDAFKEFHPKIPIKSVARYRLINHIMLLKSSEFDIKNWLYLIKKHQIEKFSDVKTNCPIKKAEGVLYVPKDRSRSQSTLKKIYHKYILNSAIRDPFDIYDQTIDKRGDGYYYSCNNKIEKVVLIFDNILSGKSTQETIDYYINGGLYPTPDRIMTFVCDKKETNLSEILNSNNCKIEICSFYATETGIKNVKQHVKQQYPKMDIKVLDPFKKLTSVVNETDMQLIKKFYPKMLSGKIREKNYLVVREFNQPKLNIMCDELLEIERVVALYCKKTEL